MVVAEESPYVSINNPWTYILKEDEVLIYLSPLKQLCKNAP